MSEATVKPLAAPSNLSRYAVVAEYTAYGKNWEEVVAHAIRRSQFIGLPNLEVDVGRLRVEESINSIEGGELSIIWEADVIVRMAVDSG